MRGKTSTQSMKSSRDTTTLALATSIRLRRILRLPHGWCLWIDTADYVHGTFYELHDNGCVNRVTVREDRGDEVEVMRPSDYTVSQQSKQEQQP